MILKRAEINWLYSSLYEKLFLLLSDRLTARWPCSLTFIPVFVITTDVKMDEKEIACSRINTSKNGCRENIRERSDYSLWAHPSAGLVADVRPSLSAETGGIVPTNALCWIRPSARLSMSPTGFLIY